MNTISYFEIHVDDIPRAVQFYTNVFGWRFERDDTIPEEYWRIFSDGIMGGLLKRHAPAPVGGEYGRNAFVNLMMVENFDATEKKIVEQGGRVTLARFSVPGKCWQGYFVDTEGNMFGLFEVDERAQ